jgi:hypothetical protein
LHNPSEDELARCIGLVGPIDPNRLYDVAIVGAGPAGLATSVYAASEGLSVLTLKIGFGDQQSPHPVGRKDQRLRSTLGFSERPTITGPPTPSWSICVRRRISARISRSPSDHDGPGTDAFAAGELQNKTRG